MTSRCDEERIVFLGFGAESLCRAVADPVLVCQPSRDDTTAENQEVGRKGECKCACDGYSDRCISALVVARDLAATAAEDNVRNILGTVIPTGVAILIWRLLLIRERERERQPGITLMKNEKDEYIHGGRQFSRQDKQERL